MSLPEERLRAITYDMNTRPNVYRGGLSHEAALAGAGYEIEGEEA